MTSKSYIFLIWLLLCSVLAASAQQAVEFTENRGQWNNSVLFRGEINNGAFFLQRNGFTVLLHNEDDMQQLAEQIHGHAAEGQTDHNTSKRTAHPRPGHGNQPDPNTGMALRSHAYAMRFAGADTNATVISEKPINSYENYLTGNDPAQWAANCRIFQAVTYKNIYPNIDVRYYAQSGQLKYDIIVYPGANINDIVMQYEGADKLQIRNRELYIKTSVGDVKELSPYSYQVNDAGKNELDCRYVLEGKDKVKFKVKQYDPSRILVIDPTLIFATFTGSTSSQWGFTATYAADGSLYSGGIVFGAGFPASTGAFQTSYNGGSGNEAFDIGIMKFNSSGTNRMYATYIGGGGADQPHSLIEDSQGNLVILGRTNSANYPLQPQDNKLGVGGGFDIVVTKLNASGTTLIGSKRIGGSNADGVNISTSRSPNSLSVFYGDDSRSEIILDDNDNIYLASCTQSNNFPTTAGASQTSLGGKQDGVLMKIAPDVGTVLFSTLFGGIEDDGTFVLALHPQNNNIYVGGSTRSNNLPGVPATGVIASSYQGGTADGFIAIFSNSGTLQRATYMGTNSMDAIYGLKFDPSGFPYITGVTLGTWPVSPAGIYNNPGTKQFIVKMQPNLSASVYSTVFGSGTATYNISPVAFAVDKCENVYVAGWGGRLSPSADDQFHTSGTFGMPTKDCNVLPNGCTTDGSDFYFFVLEKDAQDILFGAFYGQKGGFGDHVDGGTSRFDANGVIYQAICAACFISNFPGTTFPVTPGVWRPRSGNPKECNLAAVKIEMDFSGVTNGLRTTIEGKAYRDYGCVPVTVDFLDTLQKGKTYLWDFGDGNTATTTTPGTSHTYNVVGSYNVRLISVDSSKCIISDTAYTTIRVRTDRAIIGATADKLLPCESLNFEFTNTSVAPPGKPFQGAIFTWDFGDGSAPVTTGTGNIKHEFPAPGTYHVKLSLADTNYCNAPDTFTLTMRVAPNVKARFDTPPEGCVPHHAVFDNTSEAGQLFYWDFGDGSTSNEFAPEHEYTSVGTYRVKLIVVDSMTCNKSDSAFFTINVRPIPTAGFTFSPVPPLENTPTAYTNTSMNAVSYKWYFGDGDTSALANPVHQFNMNGDFNTCLIAYNQYGCPDTVCQTVSAIVSPLIAVANAFSPNGDGVNDKVYVRGYAIGKMVFRIYNRWGQLVYQSTDRNQGWDGKYKGVLQPMDAYAYTLEVEFTDGSKATKKGDITLLR
ncbi:PKD domain-containing protein [Agriterribacter sp.]|uniref:DUF7948 domain-containing protein n=1 Tax=Agriterribacter sp. TaxID=2821509 RepID=UPI002C56557B|nr:PKD domain-containing protein [Agriterribacter sp.]HRO46130.1 PKD domain-containing protein [Agriterribacter sp.]